MALAPGSALSERGFMSPPTHDRYFAELVELLAEPGPPDPDAIAELRERYDTEQISTPTAQTTPAVTPLQASFPNVAQPKALSRLGVEMRPVSVGFPVAPILGCVKA